MLARLFGKEARWFLDENTAVEPVPARRERGGLEAMPLEPAFLFSHQLLQNALPELLSQTGTSGRQFAQLLIRVWQETHHNDFPDIERAPSRSAGVNCRCHLSVCMGFASTSACMSAGSNPSAPPARPGGCGRALRRPIRC